MGKLEFARAVRDNVMERKMEGPRPQGGRVGNSGYQELFSNGRLDLKAECHNYPNSYRVRVSVECNYINKGVHWVTVRVRVRVSVEILALFLPSCEGHQATVAEQSLVLSN